MLEEDDALAAETTSEQDQDGTGLERGAGLSGTNGLADLVMCILVSVLSLVFS